MIRKFIPFISLVLIPFIFTVPSFAQTTDYKTIILNDNPVSYWRLGESSGTVGVDSANNHSLTYNDVSLGQGSLLATDTTDTAAGFNGTDGFAYIPDTGGVYDFTNTFSLEAWIKPNALPSAGNYASILAKNGAYSLRLNGNQLEFATRVNGTDRVCQAPAGLITVGNVYHVVGTYDSTHEMLYVNGNQVCSLAATGSEDVNSAALGIGTWDGSIFFFNGVIDEAAVYNTALSVTQVATHYTVGSGHAPATPTPTPNPLHTLSGVVYNDTNQNGVQDTGESGYSGATVTLNTGQTATTDSNGAYTIANLQSGTYTETLTLPNGYIATTTNPVSLSINADVTENFGIIQSSAANYQTIVLHDSPVAYYRLGESSGTTATDMANGHNGSYNSVTLSQPSLLATDTTNLSASFNGTSSFVGVGDSSGAFDFTTNFSLEAWIKPLAFPGSSTYASVVAKNGEYSLRLHGKMLEFATRVNGAERVCQVPAGYIVLGNTYHIVGTYDGSNQYIYVNGVQACSLAATGSEDINSAAFGIGTWDGSVFFFNGIVDEVAAYNTTLSAAQIAAHYTAGSGLPPMTPTPTPTPAPLALLPGQQRWTNGVSSYLFGTNDSVDYGNDNFVTDPQHIIQPALKNARFQIMREFIFHHSIIDGHRTTLGTNPQIQLDPNNPHEYDTPAAQQTTVTPNAPYGYELETRVKAIENSGMQCMIVLPSIWTDPSNPTDPFTMDQAYTDPATGQVETDLDFDKKVVAYLGNRCNLYEIGNEPDLDVYPASGPMVPHMSIQTYLNRWVEFVTALKQINPNAKFIGPVTASDQGNDCTYTPDGTTCYMRNFLQGAKTANVLPDAVSFHWYPCAGATDGFNGNGNCGPAQAQSYATVTSEVKGWIHDDLGTDVPLLITEWNADPGSNPLQENASFMTQFTQQSMQAMISAGLDGAFQFDAQSDGGFCHLDMFDSCAGTDQPKAQFTTLANMIAQYAPNTPTPTPTDTPTPTPIPTYTLAGTVYIDGNYNGVQDTGETGSSGATVSLNTGQSIITDANGNYSFTNLTAGTYTATVTVPTNYHATTTNPVTVALNANTTENFGIGLNYQQTVLNGNPVAYYRLGEASGTTATDSSNNAISATYAGGVTYGQSSLIPSDATNKALGFNGTDSSVYANSSLFNLTNTFTVEAWIKPTAFPADGEIAAIAAKNGGPYALKFDGSTLRFMTQVGSTRRYCDAPAGTISLGNIYHIVGTYDGANQNMYVNGTRVCSIAATGSINTNTNAFVIGSWDTTTLFFTGTIDEVAVYKTVLSAGTILNHYLAAQTL